MTAERLHGLHITAAGEVREITFAVRSCRNDDGTWQAVAEDFRNAEGNPFPLERGDKIKAAMPVPADVVQARTRFEWDTADGEHGSGPIEYGHVAPLSSLARKRRWWRRG